MEIYVIRHAIAYDRDPMQWPDDGRRPLSPDGERRFRRSAQGLAVLVPEVDLLLSSPWLRAWQSAEILHQVAGWPAPRSCLALEGNRSPRGVLTALREHATAERVALVGHEPQSQALVSFLLTGDSARVALELKKGSVVALAVNSTPRAGTAFLVWALPPRVLRALA